MKIKCLSLLSAFFLISSFAFGQSAYHILTQPAFDTAKENLKELRDYTNPDKYDNLKKLLNQDQRWEDKINLLELQREILVLAQFDMDSIRGVINGIKSNKYSSSTEAESDLKKYVNEPPNNSNISLEDISLESSSLTSGLGMPAQVIAGISDFLVDRTKAELTLAFFDKFKTRMEQEEELQLLFPTTYDLLVFNNPIYNNELGQLWRSSLEKDLNELPENVLSLMEKKGGENWNNLPETVSLKMFMTAADQLRKGMSPEETLNYLDVQFGDEHPQEFLRNQELKHHGVKQMIRLANLLVRNLRKPEGRITLNELNALSGEKQQYLLALIYQDNKELFENLKVGSSGVNLKKRMKDNVSQTFVHIKRVNENLRIVEGKIKKINDQDSISTDQLLLAYTDITHDFVNLFEASFELVLFKSDDQSHKREIKSYLQKGRTAIDLTTSVVKKDYGSTLMLSVNLLRPFFQDKLIPLEQEIQELKKDVHLNRLLVWFKFYTNRNQLMADLDTFNVAFANFTASNSPNQNILILDDSLRNVLTASLDAHLKRLEGNEKFIDVFELLYKSNTPENLEFDLINSLREIEKKIKKKEEDAETDYLVGETLTYLNKLESLLNSENLDSYYQKLLEYKKEELASKKQALEALVFYGGFMIDIAKAKDQKEVKNVMEKYASPVGSYRLKRKKNCTVTLNAYPGVFYGTNEGANDGWDRQLGITAPIGPAVNFNAKGNNGKRSDWAFSFFFPIIDVGAPFKYRWSKNGNDDINGEFADIQWKDIISPGAYIVFGIGKTPLAFKFGAQLTPRLKSIDNPGEGQESVVTYEDPALRVGASMTVDIPIFYLYKSKN